MNLFIKKRKKFLRALSIFLVFNIIVQVLSPTIAYALTSGATAPEATSFEPIDTTDMVNPLTGDFNYNLPLIEVPSPEGGYPLSLSYHAGIQPNEDASWVGLGWTLNPGAINRFEDGFPDDWYGSNSSRRDYWEGGVTTTTSVGVNVPIGGNASLGFGLSFSNDTYTGFGLGWNASVSFSYLPLDIGKGFGLGGGVTLGVGVTADPEHSTYVFGSVGPSVGKGKGFNAMNAGVAATFSANTSNFKESASIGFQASAGYKGLGISMSSGGGSPSFSVFGITGSSNTENGKSGSISTETSTKSLNLIFINYSKQKTRYWSDETQTSFIFGALYPSWMYYGFIPDNAAYDSYALPDEGNLVDNPNPTKVQGGAFPSFDNFQVSAQGLNGTFRGYRFRGEVHQQNTKERIPSAPNTTVSSVTYISNSNYEAPPAFRFIGDFSNNYIQSYPDYPVAGEELFYYSPPYSSPDSNDPEWMNGVNGNELAGSRHIAYYLTKWDGTIVGNGTGNQFINPVVAGLSRRAHTYQAQTANHIAGFSITNKNGVTYHYNLPAYTYNQEIHQEKISQASGLFFNRQTRSEGYAYTWYLTAITGPDYVDRGTIGELDNQDYGKWVSFEYGKWSDKYTWRTPSEGYNIDDDANWKSVSMGQKEIYYLNAVRTRSHVAIFEKDVKFDGKGASPQIYNKNYSSQNNVNTNYTYDGIYDINSSQAMRLDKIYLLNASDYNAVTSGSSGSAPVPAPGRNLGCEGCDAYENVLDKHDIDAVGRSNMENKAIRIVKFNYDYSLAKGTVNSYDINNSSVKYGKLTLKAVDFLGKRGQVTLPPVEFKYDLDEDEKNTTTVSMSGSGFVTDNSRFEVGDMIETDSANPVYGGVIVAKTFSGTSYQYLTRNSQFSGGNAATIRKTKNPPYNKNFYDNWGMYKADYVGGGNENMSRTTTVASNAGTDAWSLRKVSTSNGAEVKIALEGDTYRRSILNENKSLLLSNYSSFGNRYINFQVNTGGLDPTTLFKVGDKVNALLLKRLRYRISPIGSIYSYAFNTINSTNYSAAPVVSSVSTNGSLTLYVSPEMFNDLTSVPQVGYNPSVTVTNGNLRMYGLNRNYGGGIRVKSLTIDNLSGTQNKTVYDYNTLAPENAEPVSSGVTSYEPITIDMDEAPGAASVASAALAEAAVKAYRRELYKNVNRLWSISREVPTPGVMYEYVTVRHEVINGEDNVSRANDGKSTYQFVVFRDNMVGRQDVTQPRQAYKSANDSYYTRNLVLKKFVTNIGALKRTINYDNSGQKLSEIVNHYLDDGLESLPFSEFMVAYEQRLAQYNRQGLIKERFSEVKSVWTGYYNASNNTAAWDWKATLSAREEYPTIATGQTTKDFIRNTSAYVGYLAYDFYSGEMTKSLTTDPYGNRFITEVVPAYHKYPGMGLKLQNLDNKNMLSQQAGQYVYKVDNNNTKLGLVSASADLWSTDVAVLDPAIGLITQNNSNNGNVWRQNDSYRWASSVNNVSGLTNLTNFQDINWTAPSSSSSEWKKVNSTTLYNIYSAPLESKDINGLYAASKMGYGNTKVIVAGTPARYEEIAFSGAEDGSASAGINFGSGSALSGSSHTGSYALNVTPGTNGFTGQVELAKLDPNRKDYALSVWVKGSENISNARLYYQVNGGNAIYNTPNLQKSASGWYLLEMRIPGTALSTTNGNLVFGCANLGGSSALLFDDFRFNPVAADINAYVYDQFSGELTYVLNHNNLFVKYEYDNAGRLIKVYKEVLGKNTVPLIKETIYNSGKFMKRNVALSQDFVQTNCTGTTGGTFTYTVPAGKHIAATQSAADALAWNDLITNGPTFANSHPCPAVIYARMEFDNQINYDYSNWPSQNYSTYADIYVRFYVDKSCTIPYQLPANMDITIHQDYTSADYYGSFSSGSDNLYSVSSGSNAFYLGNICLSSYYNDYNNPYDYYSNTYSPSLLPTTGAPYIVQ